MKLHVTPSLGPSKRLIRTSSLESLSNSLKRPLYSRITSMSPLENNISLSISLLKKSINFPLALSLDTQPFYPSTSCLSLSLSHFSKKQPPSTDHACTFALQQERNCTAGTPQLCYLVEGVPELIGPNFKKDALRSSATARAVFSLVGRVLVGQPWNDVLKASEQNSSRQWSDNAMEDSFL